MTRDIPYPGVKLCSCATYRHVPCFSCSYSSRELTLLCNHSAMLPTRGGLAPQVGVHSASWMSVCPTRRCCPRTTLVTTGDYSVLSNDCSRQYSLAGLDMHDMSHRHRSCITSQKYALQHRRVHRTCSSHLLLWIHLFDWLVIARCAQNTPRR